MLKRIIITTGCIPFAISFAVLIFWIALGIWPETAFPKFIYSMKLNTAICFIVISISLISRATRHNKVSLVSACFVLFVSMVCFLEYVSGINLGIDNLLLSDLYNLNIPYPGRMAPNTAFTFILSSLLIFLEAIPSSKILKNIAATVISFFVFILGWAALLAHIQGVPVAYTWNSYTQMSPHTAVCFIILGIGFSILSWKNYYHILTKSELFNSGVLPLAFPVVLITFMTISSFYLYGDMEYKEINSANALIARKSDEVISLLTMQKNSKLLALERMAKRWEIAGGTPPNVWHYDAKNYIENIKGLKEIEWVDSSYRLRWVEPLKGSDTFVGLNVLTNKETEDTLKAAAEKNLPTMAPSIDFSQGQQDFKIYIPIRIHHQFSGFIVGVFRINEFFEDALSSEILNNFAVSLYYKGENYYNNHLKSKLHKSDLNSTKILKIYDKEWVINLVPTETYVNSKRTVLPSFVLILGLIISALSMLSIVFIIIARFKSEKLLKLNQAELENARVRADNDARHQQLIDGVKDYAIYWLDLEGNIASWNNGAMNIKQYTANEVLGKNFSIFYTEEDQNIEAPQKALSKAKINGKFEAEGWRVRKDGSKFWASVSISSLTDQNGQVNGFAKITRDITDKMKYEEKLLQSKERYDLVVRGMSVGMWDWNVVTNELYWSDKFKEIIGVDKNFTSHYNEFVNRLHPEDKEIVIKRLFDHLEHKCSYDVEYRLKHSNGKYIWIHAYGQGQWDKEGIPIRMAGSIDDISVRKHTEEEREKFVTIIEESSDFIGVADIDGDLQYHNRSALKIVGLPDGYDLSKMKIWDMHPQWASKLISDVAIPECFKSGSWQGETALLHLDGHEIPVLQNISLHRDTKGNPTAFTTIMRDITERTQAERSLKISEETLRSAIDNASIGMALVSKTGGFIRVNYALCDLLGYSETELLATDFQSITFQDDLLQDIEHLNKMISGEINTYHLEKRYIHKTGRIIWALLSVSMVYDSERKPSYFVAQIQDISEHKEVDRIKSEFISVVSHELRTPLTSIRGSLGLILGAFSKDLPEKAKELIRIANKNSEHLILLINDILDIDKIAAGQMHFNMKEHSLADITKQAVDAAIAYAQRFNIQIKIAPIDDHILIRVDSARYIQILFNFLSNAAKFSIYGRDIDVSTIQSENNIRISVTDRGLGIPEDFRSHVFEKFSQADSSSARGKSGSGLGLYISKQIAEKMGGSVGFDSEINKGSTFWVEFPIVVNALETIRSPLLPIRFQF